MNGRNVDIKFLLMQLNKYRDMWGLLVQKDGDGGDSLQRTASYYALLGALNVEVDDRGKSRQDGFKYDLDKYRVARGRYRRHPNGILKGGRWIKWYADPNNVSRDQAIVVQAALVIYDQKDEMKDVFRARIKRGLMHFNTESYDDSSVIVKQIPDIPNLHEIGQFIRGMHVWWARPLLYITDAQLILDLIFRTMSGRNLYDTDNMYMPILLAANARYGTFWGAWAKKLYAKTDAVQRLLAYHGADNNGIIPLGQLYKVAFEQLFS